MRSSCLVLVLVLSIFACVSAANGQRKPHGERRENIKWLEYEPTVVELTGKFILRTYFGPPNFGEDPKTDSKERTRILVLDHPISVRRSSDPDDTINRDSVENGREIQLVFSTDAGKLVGKRVVVTGTLFHAHTGHHHTELLIQVISLRLASSR